MDIWLCIKNVEKFKEEAMKAAIEQIGDDDEDPQCLFDEKSLTATVEECYFKDGWIEYTYIISYKGEYFMNYSDSLEVNIDMGADIVTHFMKKLGKLKTVLEATK